MGTHRSFGAARFADCRARMVFKSVGCWRMCLGLFAAADKISRRCWQVRKQLRADNRVFRPRYGSVSTALFKPLSSNVTPSFALIRATVQELKRALRLFSNWPTIRRRGCLSGWNACGRLEKSHHSWPNNPLPSLCRLPLSRVRAWNGLFCTPGSC